MSVLSNKLNIYNEQFIDHVIRCNDFIIRKIYYVKMFTLVESRCGFYNILEAQQLYKVSDYDARPSLKNKKL